MPCSCDGYEPTLSELKSIEVCKNLLYLWPLARKDKMPAHIPKGATHYYGNAPTLNQDTKDLCKMLSDLSDDQLDAWVYDGRNPSARRLADWWEAHQRDDKIRKDMEEQARERDAVRKSAIKKLTAKERAALGL